MLILMHYVHADAFYFFVVDLIELKVFRIAMDSGFNFILTIDIDISCVN